MKENYKYLFFKYIYNELGLKLLEEEIRNSGINPVEYEFNSIFRDVSKYFSLENNVDDTRLSDELRNKYIKYCSATKDLFMTKDEEQELNDFLEKSYELMLFPDIKENHCYYGPFNNKYAVPRDSIVLGLNYYEFDIDDDESFEKLHSTRESIICTTINNIQYFYAPQMNKKVAVIRYNEYVPRKVK